MSTLITNGKPMKYNKKLITYTACGLFYFSVVCNNNAVSPSQMNEEALKLAEEGNYDKALKMLKNATNIKRVSAIAYHNIGYTYHLKGDYTLAAQNYETSIDRDPTLVPPRQNVGKIYYESARYKEAIDQGEKVLELDPTNKQVITWLPDAYKKYTEQRILAKYGNTDIGMSTEGWYDAFPLLRDFGWYPLTFSYTIAGGFFINKDKSPPKAIFLPTTSRLPMYFDLQLKTLVQVNIRVATAPIAGLLNPAFFNAEEAIEVIYWHKQWFFGTGVLLSQFDTSIDRTFGISQFLLNTEIDTANDWKLGILGGYNKKSHSLSMTMYSRYLLRDPTAGTTPRGISIDRNLFSLVYQSKASSTSLQWSPSVLVEFRINESYISEYQTSIGPVIGHYFGYYDFNLAIIFPNFGKHLVKFPLVIGFKIINRIYFIDLNDPDPSAFGNGQGFLGFNTNDVFKGDFFSGLRTNAHKLLIFSKQSIYKYVSFQETIGFDYQPSSSVPVHVLEIYFQVSFRI